MEVEHMKALSTSDVSLEALEALRRELSPDIELNVEERQFFFKSAEPPSWVVFLAQADWWIKILAGYAALYVAELVKEAAKDSWKNRARVLRSMKAAGGQLKRFATGIATLRHTLSTRTRVEVGLPIPDEFNSTSLELDGSEPDDLALQVALFVQHVPDVSAFIKGAHLDSGGAAAGIRLKLLPDGSLDVRWQDSEAFEEHHRVFPLRDAV
jgi:hypothetical protein